MVTDRIYFSPAPSVPLLPPSSQVYFTLINFLIRRKQVCYQHYADFEIQSRYSTLPWIPRIGEGACPRRSKPESRAD